MTDSRNDRVKSKAWRVLLAGCLIVIAVPLAALYIAARPAMPRHLLRQVKPRMTKAEVREVLGKPKNVEADWQWEYSRWGNAGWVEVAFDKDDRVTYVNDESAFP